MLYRGSFVAIAARKAGQHAQKQSVHRAFILGVGRWIPSLGAKCIYDGPSHVTLGVAAAIHGSENILRTLNNAGQRRGAPPELSYQTVVQYNGANELSWVTFRL